MTRRTDGAHLGLVDKVILAAGVARMIETIDRPAPRFIVYQYCVSIVFLTFKRSSGIIRVPAGRSRVLRGLPYVLISLVAGWWGIPWGPFWTVATVWRNLRGGIDVTDAVMLYGDDPESWPAPPEDPNAPPIVGSLDGWR